MRKAELHRLVDELPEEKEIEALRLLEGLRDRGEYSVDDAPFDDEPLNEDDEKSLDEAYEDIRAGRVVSHEDLKRELFGS